MKIATFGARDATNRFARLTPEELDDISFGVVQVDREGRILVFNRTEGAIPGSTPKAALGKNFFKDVAVCADVSGFRERFDEGVARGKVNVLFEWCLGKAWRDVVQVHLKSAVEPGKFWIFIRRL
jgi:photoactive yellow protein